jgi:hypothetical protein
VMYGTFKSTCRVWLATYHGAFVIILSILDWLRCIIVMLDLLEQAHSSIPYVQIGLIMVLYKSTLLSSDMMDLCPIIQYMSFTFKFAFFFLNILLNFAWFPEKTFINIVID